ncbi:hypothetical protein ABZ841_38960, partial [Streptomyces flaveolus]
MIELVLYAGVAALVGWLVQRRRQRRSAVLAAGGVAGVPCMLKWPAQGARWNAGRLRVGDGAPLVFTPSLGRQEAVLPT